MSAISHREIVTSVIEGKKKQTKILSTNLFPLLMFVLTNTYLYSGIIKKKKGHSVGCSIKYKCEHFLKAMLSFCFFSKVLWVLAALGKTTRDTFPFLS